MIHIDDQGRPEPDPSANEVDTLLGFLDYQRATLEWKCRGLGADALNVSVGASSMTLGGIMKHLAWVEDHWFSYFLHNRDRASMWSSVDWAANPDWEWTSARDDSPDDLRAVWTESVGVSRDLVGVALETAGLDQPCARSWPNGESPSLRWVIVHMIEEYARHNGHADLIREAVDGETGE